MQPILVELPPLAGDEELVDRIDSDLDASKPRKGKVWPNNRVEGEDEVSTDVPEDAQLSDSSDEELKKLENEALDAMASSDES